MLQCMFNAGSLDARRSCLFEPPKACENYKVMWDSQFSIPITLLLRNTQLAEVTARRSLSLKWGTEVSGEATALQAEMKSQALQPARLPRPSIYQPNHLLRRSPIYLPPRHVRKEPHASNACMRRTTPSVHAAWSATSYARLLLRRLQRISALSSSHNLRSQTFWHGTYFADFAGLGACELCQAAAKRLSSSGPKSLRHLHST